MTLTLTQKENGTYYTVDISMHDVVSSVLDENCEVREYTAQQDQVIDVWRRHLNNSEDK